MNLLPKNEGSFDRLFRVALGLAGLTLAFTGVIGPWGYLGAIPLLTGILGSCPLYTMLGIRTCPLDQKPAPR
jgi:hypothetical protein